MADGARWADNHNIRYANHMAPCGHRDTDPLDPAASPGELSHPDAERLEDGAAPSTPTDGSLLPDEDGSGRKLGDAR